MPARLAFHARVVEAAFLLTVFITAGCGKPAAATEAEPSFPESEPAELAPSAKAPAPASEPAMGPKPAAPSATEGTQPGAATARLCSDMERWLAGKRYGMFCNSALQAGCDESLGLIIASADRSLKTDPERLRREGATVNDLLAIWAEQIASSVVKPAEAVLNEIKAYNPREEEKATYTKLIADHEEFLRIAKRWQDALSNYDGKTRKLDVLKKDTEAAAKKSFLHEVDYRALCLNKNISPK